MKAKYFKLMVILIGFGITYLGNACGPEGTGLTLNGSSSRSSGSSGPDTTAPSLTTGSTGPTPQEVSTHSDAVCETDGDYNSYIENWMNSHGPANCYKSKNCQNCCGESNRFDRFWAKCFTPQAMDGSTLGSQSAVVCEDTGMSYLLGFALAKKELGINCTTLKAAMNGCGPGSSMDTFYVKCDR